MKKFVVLGMGLCMALAFTSCKSSESAYKKAYEKAKQQELAEAPVAEEAPAAAPVVAAPVAAAPTTPVAVGTVREEKVQLVSGDGLKAYSVVCGSFGVQANAQGLKDYLVGEGYQAGIVKNVEKNMFRVIIGSYDTKADAARARESFKHKYPSRADFQGSWILLNK